MKKIDVLFLVLLPFSIGNLANALWMLGSPVHWYHNVSGVPDFGPVNEHFIRDLGAMFLLFGTILLISAFRPKFRKIAIGINLFWYFTHALVHLFDTYRGLVGKEHLLVDLPAVYVPTILLAGLYYFALKAVPEK